MTIPIDFYGLALSVTPCLVRVLPSGTQPTTLIYKPDGIGDYVLATGAIALIIERSKFPCVLVVSEEVAPLARLQFPETKVIGLRGAVSSTGGRWALALLDFVAGTRALRFHTAISLRHSLNDVDHTLLKIANPTVSHGIPDGPFQLPLRSSTPRFLFTNPSVYPKQQGQFPLQVEAHARVISSAFGINSGIDALTPCLPTMPPLPSTNGPGSTLLVFPITRSPLRNYPWEKLAGCITNVVPGTFQKCILAGAPAESQRLHTLALSLPRSMPVTVVTPNSILDAVQLIQQSSCLLAMESGPAHIAVALRKPGVFILGGGHFGHFAPWSTSQGQHWLHHHTECYQCDWRCPFVEPLCIREISPEQILYALLSTTSHSTPPLRTGR